LHCCEFSFLLIKTAVSSEVELAIGFATKSVFFSRYIASQMQRLFSYAAVEPATHFGFALL